MQMKLFVFPFICLCVCMPVCFGLLSDADEAADGYLTAGEYDGGVVRPEGYEQLYVMGGGANRIEARDHSYIEVQYTSTPLSNSSGIYDIMIGNNSKLLYLGGVTEEITLGDNATAELRGGRVDYITAYHLAPNYLCQATIYCREGWQWIYNAGKIKGLSGLWENGSAFNIQFIDPTSFFDPTWKSISIIEVPEPATLALLGLGGGLLRRKK